MSVWLREIAGWILLGCGLAVFYLAYQLLLARRVIDLIPLTFIGFVIFRGGLHLIKVATAARACREATRKEPAPMKTVRAQLPARGASATVIPGPKA